MQTDMELTIPLSIEDVTGEWLTTALRNSGALAPDGRVAGMRATRIGEGTGLMGEIYRVGIDAEGGSGDTPSSVVVKLPSHHEGSRAQGVALGMYEAEVRFYQELAPRAPGGLPTVFHAAINPGTAEFVIVMEDLSHLGMVDQIAGMTVAQATAAVHVLADIHATWWDDVQTPELEWIPTMVGDRITMVDGLLAQIWPVAAQAIESALPAGGMELGEAFSHSYLALQKQYSSRPWTLAHQDYRVDNMLFGDPGSGAVAVIDWQGIGRGPGGYDLAYILGGSMSIDDRRAHEVEIVETYHRRLVERGIDYSYQQVWDDYVYAHVLGGLAVTIVAAATLDTTDPRAQSLVATMAERHFTAAIDHGCTRYLA